MSKSPAVVVCDAGPLIHLDELGAADLLGDFGRVLVPESVWREVEHHRPGALTRELSLERVRPQAGADETVDALVRAFALDPGETEGIQVARDHGAIFLTDDAAARLAAESCGLRVHGTIGVLLRAVRRGQRTSEDVVAMLRSLPMRSTLHIRRSLLEEAIQRVIRGE